MSCSPTKHLGENEYILYRNGISGAPNPESSYLPDLYKQKSNRKFLGALLYVRLYNFGKLFYDSAKTVQKKERLITKFDDRYNDAKSNKHKSKLLNKKEKKVKRKDLKLNEGNAFMRSFGEPPEIVDSIKLAATAESFRLYLFSKGYFSNRVSTSIDTVQRKKRIKVKYTVSPGSPSFIDTIRYNIQDKRIDSLIKNPMIFETKLVVGEKYDEDNLNAERENINKLLKDNGYYNFQRANITFELDTLKKNKKIDLLVVVSDTHKVYRLSKMYFNRNDLPKKNYKTRDTLLYRNVYYVYYKKTFLRKLLDYKITTRPNDIYNQTEFQRTQQLLGSLDMYKFVNINIIENKYDTVGNTLTAYINTQPMDKFQVSQEYGLSVGQALIPGPFLSFSLKTRNIFKWLETIENTFRYSFEAQYTAVGSNETYTAREFSANTSINLSQLIFQTKMREWLKNYNPKVKFQSGYTYVIRPEYIRESFKSGLTYHLSRNRYSSFFMTPIEISYINSNVSDAYADFLNDLKVNSGSNLYLSFNPSIVTNFHFSYVFNNHDFEATKITKYYKPSVEFGGLIPSFVSNIIDDEADSSRLFNKQIFEYVRLGLDVRYYIPVKKKNSLVLRFNAGYAQPFGISNKENSYVLPYEKYFFSGGNSSIRAWKPRRLGPGAYNGNVVDNFLYEQPGEILFESNVELRFNMISMLKGALFVDAGNVWNIKDEKDGAQFKFPNAINQLAVGAGIGIRLDFSFLILRLDIANKVVDPAMPDGDKFVGKLSFKESVYNIGIGYPF